MFLDKLEIAYKCLVKMKCGGGGGGNVMLKQE